MTELRLEGITTIADADVFLPGYLVRHNAAFAVPAADPGPAWRAWPVGLTAEAVFAFWYDRKVSRDDTVSWAPEALAVPRRPDDRTRAGQRIIVAERLDGSLWAELDGSWERLAIAPPSAPTLRARQTRRPMVDRPVAEEGSPVERSRPTHDRARPWRPAADHPWRRRPDQK